MREILDDGGAGQWIAPYDAALVDLLAWLEDAGYDFVTPTGATVRRWRAKGQPSHPDLRDVFGWGFSFARHQLDPELTDILTRAELLAQDETGFSSKARVATVHGRLLLHSASSGAGQDAVFFGPDSYRYANLIRRELTAFSPRRVLDIGAGAGVGAILAGGWTGALVMASDLNPAALRLARANAAHAGVAVEFRLADGLPEGTGDFDLIIANPPYVAGTSGRTYKDGGGRLGERLAVDWVTSALKRLAPDGRIVLYTGSPIIAGGVDPIQASLTALAHEADIHLTYDELDPDIFGGELRREVYAGVERIAAVGAVLKRSL